MDYRKLCCRPQTYTCLNSLKVDSLIDTAPLQYNAILPLQDMGSNRNDSVGLSPRQSLQLSPYFSFDPASVITQNDDPFIFPEGNKKQRGRFEMAFSQIGMTVMGGAAVGGTSGFIRALRDKQVSSLPSKLRRTQQLNYITKTSAGVAQQLGVIALLYSVFGVLSSWARGTDDTANSVASGALTGALYRSSLGLRASAIGAGFGAAIGAGVHVAQVYGTRNSRI